MKCQNFFSLLFTQKGGAGTTTHPHTEVTSEPVLHTVRAWRVSPAESAWNATSQLPPFAAIFTLQA